MTNTTEWDNKIVVPNDVDPLFAKHIIQVRRHVLIHSYLRWGLDRDILGMKAMVSLVKNLKDLQAAWGWEFNFYDSLFENFKHVYDAKRLITNKGLDAGVCRAAGEVLDTYEANERIKQLVT